MATKIFKNADPAASEWDILDLAEAIANTKQNKSHYDYEEPNAQWFTDNISVKFGDSYYDLSVENLTKMMENLGFGNDPESAQRFFDDHNYKGELDT